MLESIQLKGRFEVNAVGAPAPTPGSAVVAAAGALMLGSESAIRWPDEGWQLPVGRVPQCGAAPGAGPGAGESDGSCTAPFTHVVGHQQTQVQLFPIISFQALLYP